MEQRGETKAEGRAQHRVRQTQRHRPRKAVEPRADHQRAEAVHRRLVAVIGAKAHAEPAQGPQQRAQAGRQRQIEQGKGGAARRRPRDALPKADGGAAGQGVFRLQRPAGKAHPHEALHPKDLPRRQHKAHPQRHAQPPQALRPGKAEPAHQVVKAGVRVAAAVLCQQDGPAEKPARQRHQTPAGQRLPRHRVAGEVDIGKTVNAAVAHLRPLAGQKEQREKGGEVQRRHKRQPRQRIAGAILKVHEADAQQHAEQRHRHGGVVRAEQAGQQADEQDGKSHDERRTHRHGRPVKGLLLLRFAGGDAPFQDRRVQLQRVIKFSRHGFSFFSSMWAASRSAQCMNASNSPGAARHRS